MIAARSLPWTLLEESPSLFIELICILVRYSRIVAARLNRLYIFFLIAQLTALHN